MKIIKEYFDEKTNEYVFELSTTEEEKVLLEQKCNELNLTVNEYINKALSWGVNNPKEFHKWIKEARTDKNPLGILGSPKYKIGDKTGFYIKPYGKEDEIFCIGTVEIVDSYGTFEQNEEPSYDIMVENFNNTGKCLVKHIRESNCYNISI